MEVLYTRSERTGGLNVGRYSNPKLDALADRIAESSDEAARRALIREALLIEKADVAHIPLHQQLITWAARKGIGMAQGPDNQMRLRLVRVP